MLQCPSFAVGLPPRARQLPAPPAETGLAPLHAVIGRNFKTKINANIGNSAVSSSIEEVRSATSCKLLSWAAVCAGLLFGALAVAACASHAATSALCCRHVLMARVSWTRQDGSCLIPCNLHGAVARESATYAHANALCMIVLP